MVVYMQISPGWKHPGSHAKKKKRNKVTRVQNDLAPYSGNCLQSLATLGPATAASDAQTHGCSNLPTRKKETEIAPR
jgi:hypothetical protein